MSEEKLDSNTQNEEPEDLLPDGEPAEVPLGRIEMGAEDWEDVHHYYYWGDTYDEIKKFTCPDCGREVLVFAPFKVHPEGGHDNIHFISEETARKVNPVKEKYGLETKDKWVPEAETSKKELDFARFLRYLKEVESGEREPNGRDEYGKVPYICEKCKEAQATVYTPQGNYCQDCHDEIEESSSEASN